MEIDKTDPIPDSTFGPVGLRYSKITHTPFIMAVFQVE